MRDKNQPKHTCGYDGTMPWFYKAQCPACQYKRYAYDQSVVTSSSMVHSTAGRKPGLDDYDRRGC